MSGDTSGGGAPFTSYTSSTLFAPIEELQYTLLSSADFSSSADCVYVSTVSLILCVYADRIRISVHIAHHHGVVWGRRYLVPIHVPAGLVKLSATSRNAMVAYFDGRPAVRALDEKSSSSPFADSPAPAAAAPSSTHPFPLI